MNQQLERLKLEMADTVKYSVEHKGEHVIFDENGPAGFSLITAIIDVLDAQAKEIERLKQTQETRR